MLSSSVGSVLGPAVVAAGFRYVALDLEGFVTPEIHQALLEAKARPGSTAELQYVVDERWFEDANVIGRIAGGHRPEQAVVLVAHWDAGGLSEPDPDGVSIANASGLAVLLAVAEARSHDCLDPECTVLACQALRALIAAIDAALPEVTDEGG